MSQKPVLDEESFTRLLAAAYVMQEHTDRMRANVPVSDFTEIVAQIVDCQHVIQTGEMELEPALELVVSRLQKVAGAIGAAVCVREGETLLYKAGSGTAAMLVGTSLPIDASLAARCIKEGKTVKVPFTEADPQLDHNLAHRVGAQSLLISPVYHEGRIAAAIELFFSEARLLEESAVRACELMAGLAAEAIAQSAEEELKQELAAERASVLMALETLKPQLQRLVQEPAQVSEVVPQPAKPEGDLCRACGRIFAGNESYCGVCGASRATGKYPGGELQSKWATLWERQLLTGETPDAIPIFKKKVSHPALPVNDEDTQEWIADLPRLEGEADTTEEQEGTEGVELAGESAEGERAAIPSTLVHRWTASLSRSGDSGLPPRQDRLHDMWLERRGDISLALATVVVLIAFGWGFWPSSDTSAASTGNTVAQTPAVKRRTKPKAPQLTFLERTLVTLGLAEAPPAPQYLGNPQARVWVDLSTALYYCPGSESYGKTPKGRFTTQEDAQQEQFEPAIRKPCE